MRGDQILTKPRFAQGSSPHARGALIRATSDAKQLRDHPRMRGERHRLGGRLTRCRGIIPACAGSTRSARVRASRCWGSSPHARGAPSNRMNSAYSLWDHPRMRGEHPTRRMLCRSPLGSSPHARGAPACATSWCRPTRDHPRMRGEHVAEVLDGQRRDGIIPACAGSTRHLDADEYEAEGSSPHARGARSSRRSSSWA